MTKPTEVVVTAIDQALQSSPGLRIAAGQAYSMTELCAMTGRGEAWVRHALHAAVRAGVWEVVRVRRKTLIGTMQVVPAYRPVSKKKA